MVNVTFILPNSVQGQQDKNRANVLLNFLPGWWKDTRFKNYRSKQKTSLMFFEFNQDQKINAGLLKLLVHKLTNKHLLEYFFLKGEEKDLKWVFPGKEQDLYEFYRWCHRTYECCTQAHTAVTVFGSSLRLSLRSGWTSTASPSSPSVRPRTASWRSEASCVGHVSCERLPVRPACSSLCCPGSEI